MFEVEVKARIIEPEQSLKVQRMVSDWEALPEVVQEDIYFSHPCRNFSRTDEALRLRKTGDIWCMTYKGPKLDGVSKTREEMEIRISPDARSILERLGFSEVGRVVKERRMFRKGDVLLCLDDVVGLGEFIELESISHDKKALPALLGILSHLGLESETRSYLELLLKDGG